MKHGRLKRAENTPLQRVGKRHGAKIPPNSRGIPWYKVYTPESTNIDPDVLAPWKSVFLYQPVVFRVHGIVFQGVIISKTSAFPGLEHKDVKTQMLWLTHMLC